MKYRHIEVRKFVNKKIADLVLDNKVPSGDGLLKIGEELTGPASTLAGVFWSI